MGFLMKIEIIRHCAVLLLLLAIAGCAGLKLADPLKPDKNDWPTFGRTQDRINATDEIVSPPLQLAWEQDISSGMGFGSPVVIDSIVIVTNMKGELYAFNANTGKRIGWVNVGDAIHGSPVIESTIAYIGTTNSRESLVAYDLMDGKAIWKKEYGDIEVTPLLLDHKLYFGNTAGMFFCVDNQKGEQVWKFRLSENTKQKGIRSSATTSDSLIIFGAEDGSVYALDIVHGSERWSYDTDAPVFAAPAVYNRIVYCGNDNGDFFAINSKDGTLAWKFKAGGSIYATPSFGSDLVLIGTTAGKLYALDAANGVERWSREFSSVINSSAIVSGNVAYVGTLKKELCAINITDGSVIWSKTLEGRIKTSPAVARGKVFVATDDKTILAFSPSEKK